MKIFETDRLYINEPSLENIENLVILFSDPEVMRYIGVRTRKQTQENIEAAIQAKKKYGFIFGDVYEKSSDEFVGRVGLLHLERNDKQAEIEVGYILHKKFWGKGYATELAKALIDWGFSHLSVEKLIAVIHPNNDGSRRVLEKLGMHYVGMVHCYNKELEKYEVKKNNFIVDKLNKV